MAEVILKEEGKAEVMGIDINISQILRGKIIDQYLAKLTEEDFQKIFDYISTNLWNKGYDGTLQIKRTEDTGYGWKNTTTIGDIIKNQFEAKIKEELVKKVDEIIATTDYQNKVEEIANELVEYAINGYKEDMKTRIRERLVGNLLDAVPSFAGVDLRCIINEEINKRIHY